MQAMNRFAWCLDALSTIRALPPVVIADETHEASFTFGAASHPADIGLLAYRRSLTDRNTGTIEESAADVYVGSLAPSAKEAPAPVAPAIEAHARRVVALFHRRLARRLAHFASRDGVAEVAAGLVPTLLPLDLLEAAAVHGPPPPVPAPPFEDAALDDAARRVVLTPPTRKRLSMETTRRKLVASYAISGYDILLTANLKGYPHGLEIFIREPTGKIFDALRVDPADAQCRSSADGDAFAMRRFVTWLREIVLRSGTDRRLTFHDEISEEKYRTNLAELLLYDEPYFGDDLLIDWRYELDLLLPRAAHAHFDDAPAWRAFLGRVVHPALAVAPTVEPR